MERTPEGILFDRSVMEDYLICASIGNAIMMARLNDDGRLSREPGSNPAEMPNLGAQTALLAAGVEAEMPEPTQGISLEDRLHAGDARSHIFVRNDEVAVALEMLKELDYRAATYKHGMIPTHGTQKAIIALYEQVVSVSSS